MIALLLLLLTLPALAEETTAPPVDWDELEKNYIEHSMDYAKKLYLHHDGSPEDEARSQKSDLLNYRIREKTVTSTKQMLAKMKDVALRRELLRRLGTLYEQQAENISRQAGAQAKEKQYKAHLVEAIYWYTQIRKNYPDWKTDFVLFSMAENYMKLKDYAAAEVRYKELVRKERHSPLLSDALLALGNLYFERQGFATARGYYGQILQTDEQKLHAYAHYKIGWSFFNESSHEQAMAALEKAIRESRRLQEAQQENKKLGVEEEALSDLVLFYSEGADPSQAKVYFEKIVSAEKAEELRFFLVKRYYESGKHLQAKIAATELLAETAKNEQKNKLFLILISVAEKLKDRELSLNTAQKFTAWLESQGKEKQTERAESEEYLRLYAQRLHYEAETLKQKETWMQAKRSYEIYLHTFGEEKEAGEARFRFAVLLMNQQDFLKAYEQVKILIPTLEASHPRHKEVLKLQVQSLEMARNRKKESVKPEELLAAYDSFTMHYTEDLLAMEGLWKAAELAKTVEGPELAAKRFRFIADHYPKEEIARNAIAEALTTLIKAEKWEALREQSDELEKSAAQLENDKTNLKAKIVETKELAMMKIAEKWEKEGKIAEALVQYESFLSNGTSASFAKISLARMANLAEKQLKDGDKAIHYWTEMKEQYKDSTEGKRANLELARLYEKTLQPLQAAENYLEYAHSNGDHTASLTNAALLFESVGERLQAGKIFLSLSEKLGKQSKEGWQALEAGCNSLLLATYNDASEEIYKEIANCAQKMAARKDASLWQTRAAWAMEHIGDKENAAKIWAQVAKGKASGNDRDKAYIAMAKVRALESQLIEFQAMRFSKANEKPEANILKKSHALEGLEARAGSLIKISSPKQILLIQGILESAYLDFADTMESAAYPVKLSEAERTAMKESFVSFATEMRKRATAMAEKQKGVQEAMETSGRSLASAKSELASIAGTEASELEKALFEGKENPAIIARLAIFEYEKGQYGNARYLSQRWKKDLEKIDPKDLVANSASYEALTKELEEKIPSNDPIVKEWL